LSHAPCRFTCHPTEPVKALDERSGHVHHGSAGNASYQDPLILIGDGTLTIQRYYLPAGAKRIRLTAIVGVEQYAMDPLDREVAHLGLDRPCALVQRGCRSAPQAAGIRDRPRRQGQAGRHP